MRVGRTPGSICLSDMAGGRISNGGFFCDMIVASGDLSPVTDSKPHVVPRRTLGRLMSFASPPEANHTF